MSTYYIHYTLIGMHDEMIIGPYAGSYEADVLQFDKELSGLCPVDRAQFVIGLALLLEAGANDEMGGIENMGYVLDRWPWLERHSELIFAIKGLMKAVALAEDI